MIKLQRGQSKTGVQELEELLGGDSAITVSTVQLAIQMCIEVLGSRTHIIPCILPVNAPPDTLAAVMRAGAQPMLLDINGGSLQMDPEMLQEALEGVESAVVILTRPGGLPVDAALLELVQDVPTIIDTRLLPHANLDEQEDLCGTFNIFDLSSVGLTGAVIRHKFKAQQDMLRMLRSGIMGHSGDMPDTIAVEAMLQLHFTDALLLLTRRVAETLRESLYKYTDRGIIPWEVSAGRGPTPYFVFVPNNAKRIVTQLRSHGFEASQASFPLHLLDEVRQRYEKVPEYLVAEKVVDQVIAIPAHEGVSGHEQEIASIIGEVSNG